MKKSVLIVEDQFVEANFLRSMLEKSGYTVTGIARSVVQARELIATEKPGLVLLDIFLSGKLSGIDLAKELKEENIAFVYLSANSNEDVLLQVKATQPYGFLVKPFREKDLLITLDIAQYRHEHSLESGLRKEAHLQEQLSAILSSSNSWSDKLFETCKILQPFIPFDFITAGSETTAENDDYNTSYLRTGFGEYQKIQPGELSIITRRTVPDILALAANTMIDKNAVFYNNVAFDQLIQRPSLTKLYANTFDVKSQLSLPVRLSRGRFFSFRLFSKNADMYNAGHIALYGRLQRTIEQCMDSLLNNSVDILLNSKKGPNNPSTHKSERFQGFNGIIGTSHQILTIFDHISQVAPTDTSVLILGESGTGKERIAACIHELSTRKDQKLIKVNCAALPSTLIESELFGHEKGAFTGAIDRRIGKFEQADNSSIFLDEIGELPLELQTKLLRVLQEREIERIGARSVTKVNVRIIAATNRNLEKEVAEGRFRLDLYYRLNVFPLVLPPLRERRDDIPALVDWFIARYNRKAGKSITGLSEKVWKKFSTYDWPGNIRELEHLIERSVLLAKGVVIEDISLPLFQQKELTMSATEKHIKTIEENERDHILSVLKQCNGRIWGPGAAAEILRIPPTTLKSKMIRLGIRKEYTE